MTFCSTCGLPDGAGHLLGEHRIEGLVTYGTGPHFAHETGAPLTPRGRALRTLLDVRRQIDEEQRRLQDSHRDQARRDGLLFALAAIDGVAPITMDTSPPGRA